MLDMERDPQRRRHQVPDTAGADVSSRSIVGLPGRRSAPKLSCKRLSLPVRLTQSAWESPVGWACAAKRYGTIWYYRKRKEILDAALPSALLGNSH